MCHFLLMSPSHLPPLYKPKPSLGQGIISVMIFVCVLMVYSVLTGLPWLWCQEELIRVQAAERSLWHGATFPWGGTTTWCDPALVTDCSKNVAGLAFTGNLPSQPQSLESLVLEGVARLMNVSFHFFSHMERAVSTARCCPQGLFLCVLGNVLQVSPVVL